MRVSEGTTIVPDPSKILCVLLSFQQLERDIQFQRNLADSVSGFLLQ